MNAMSWPGRGAAPYLVGALAATAVLAVAAPPSGSGTPAVAPTAPNHAALGCLIEPDRVADIGTQVVGLVENLRVERGDYVKTGQTVAELRSDIERANMGVAQLRATTDAEVRAAEASLALAEQKVERAQALVADSFVSTQALDQARAERDVARHKLEQTRSQQQVYREERRVAEAQLRLRSVRSPLSGIVVERYVNQGERVEDRPLMRVAVVDPLRVELMVPTSQWGRFRPGDLVTIQPELPDTPPQQAKVALVDRAMDAASNTFRVRLSLPNPQGALPSGLRCKAELPGLRQASVGADASWIRLDRGPAGRRVAAPSLPRPGDGVAWLEHGEPLRLRAARQL